MSIFFHNTKEMAKNRIMLTMQNEQLYCSSKTMQQVKKEIKEVINKHLNISDDCYDIKIIRRDEKREY